MPIFPTSSFNTTTLPLLRARSSSSASSQSLSSPSPSPSSSSTHTHHEELTSKRVSFTLSICLLAICLFFTMVALMDERKRDRLRHEEQKAQLALPSKPFKTLVVYNYHCETPLSSLNRENLEFFLEVAVGHEADPLIDYVIVIRDGDMDPPVSFPNVPNLRVTDPGQRCFGSSGATSILKNMDIRQYDYYFFLDSSVRGPFLPRYIARRGTSQRWAKSKQASKPWTSVFTDLLNDKVKLVGRTISCESEMHVQAPVFATDAVGLQVLRDGGVLECATDPVQALQKHEFGATRSIFKAGYTIDCMMLRYRGLNFTELRHTKCTKGDNPSIAFLNDGLPINPLEVVFVVSKPHIMASDHTLRRYSDYLLGRVDVRENEYFSDRVQWVLETRKQRLTRVVEECNAKLDLDHLLTKCSECDDAPPLIQNKFIQDFFTDGYDFRFIIQEKDVESLPYEYCEPFLRYAAPDVSG